MIPTDCSALCALTIKKGGFMKTIDANLAAQLVKEGMDLTHEERMKKRDERLHALIEYVREKSPHLKKLYENLPDNWQLSDLPITEKSDIMENFADWVTDTDIRLSDVESYCNRDSSDSSLYLDKYTVLHTSGTTGSPLYMVRDDHRNKLHGQLIAQRLLKGADPTLMDHTKHKIAAVIYAVHGSSSYESFLRQQRSVPGFEGNMIAINVLENVATIVERLNAFQPEMVSAYGSVLVVLAQEKLKGNLNIPVKMFANSAEALSPENHKLVEETFGCVVKNNYCMTEGGEIAMTQDGPQLLLNEDFIIIEPVDGNRNPVKDPDEWSEGILVTDLTNYVQPIIRYFVNDAVKIEHIPNDQVRMPVLQIRGRACSVFTICDRTYTTAGIDATSELVTGVLDFQFTQVADDEICVRGVAAQGFDHEQTMTNLAKELKQYFDDNGLPEAKVSYSLEPLIKKERGGKTPRYIDLRS